MSSKQVVKMKDLLTVRVAISNRSLYVIEFVYRRLHRNDWWSQIEFPFDRLSKDNKACYLYD